MVLYDGKDTNATMKAHFAIVFDEVVMLQNGKHKIGNLEQRKVLFLFVGDGAAQRRVESGREAV